MSLLKTSVEEMEGCNSKLYDTTHISHFELYNKNLSWDVLVLKHYKLVMFMMKRVFLPECSRSSRRRRHPGPGHFRGLVLRQRANQSAQEEAIVYSLDKNFKMVTTYNEASRCGMSLN